MNKTRRTLIAAIAAALAPVPLALRADLLKNRRRSQNAASNAMLKTVVNSALTIRPLARKGRYLQDQFVF